LVIKEDTLIKPLARGKVVVDIACGKGGDVGKFRRAKARFVLGTDVNYDNILNVHDGAIQR